MIVHEGHEDAACNHFSYALTGLAQVICILFCYCIKQISQTSLPIGRGGEEEREALVNSPPYKKTLASLDCIARLGVLDKMTLQTCHCNPQTLPLLLLHNSREPFS